MLARARRWLNPYPDTPGALRLGFAAAYIGVVGALVVYSNFVSPCSEQLPAARQWAMIGLLATMLFIERFELVRDAATHLAAPGHRPADRPHRARAGRCDAGLHQAGGPALCRGPLRRLLRPGRRHQPAHRTGLLGLCGGSRPGKPAASAWRSSFDSLTIVVIFTLLLIFVHVIAGHIDRDQRSRQQMRQLLDQLETSHRQLQAYAGRVAELAAAAERNRLARDIHDSLGHYLTAISIQLEKAQAYRARNPEEADQAIRDAKQTARAALQDVRQSVSTLRDTGDRFSLRQSLADLVGRMDGGTIRDRLPCRGG